MSSEWITVDELLRCGDLQLVQDGNHGGSYPKVEEFVSDGVPLITGACLIDGGVDYSKAGFISPGRAAQLRVGLAKPGDVLLTHKGTMGKTAIVPQSRYPLTILNPQITLYRVSSTGRVESRYLKFFFDSKLFQDLLVQISATSTINTLSIKEQKKLEIPVPPEFVQRNIVGILGALDDRITLLRETNATLESIAQALFKSWFVDFDPVRAKMEGRAPEGMDEATAALFSDSFEETELGLVPRGWHCSSIGKSFVLTMGQSPPGDTYNEVGDGLPFYQGRTEFGFRFPAQRVFGTSPSRFAEPGDTLVSVRAPVGDVNMALERCSLGRGVAGVRNPEGFNSFVFYTLRMLKPKFELYDSEGTVFGSINKKDFQALPVINASNDVLQAFDALASALDNKIVSNEEQIRSLASLRDTLLPRLISGRLRLPEAELEMTAGT